ncbi:MAG: hypothetical protein MZV64_17765 [Ignavibacteriales bacterium]|nr:hypothetical protein [Ignavibacteriales bacterium]
MSQSSATNPADDILQNLETRLAGTLKPIQPSRDVVQRLRARHPLPGTRGDRFAVG